jgi:PAS domain S-box-containing protein
VPTGIGTASLPAAFQQRDLLCSGEMTPTIPLVAARFRRHVRAAAIIVVVISIGTFVSQLMEVAGPLRFVAGYPVIHANNSIAYIAASVALLGLLRGRPAIGAVGAVIAVVVGGATVLQYLTDIDFGIDRLVMEPFAADDAAIYPGRMSAASALTVLMIGTAMLELTVRRLRPGARQVAGILGGMAATLAFTVLISYATDVLGGLRVGYVTAMSIPGAICSALLGGALVLIGWDRTSVLSVFPKWVPVAAGSSVLVATFLMSGSLAIAERARAVEQVKEQAIAVHYQVTGQLAATLRPVRQLGAFRNGDLGGQPADWAKAVNSAIANTPGLIAVEMVTENFEPVVRSVNELWDRFTPVRLAEAFSAWPDDERTEPGSQFVAASGFPLILVVAVPSCEEVGCRGYTIALLDPRTLLAPVLRTAAPGYAIELSTSVNPVYMDPEPPVRPDLTARADTVADGLHWAVSAWPQPRTAATLISDLPEVVAGLGFVVAALLAATLQLVLNSVTTARRNERVRLATAIEGNTEGIWEIDLPTGDGLRSPGLWRLLGHDPDDVRPGDSPAKWSSLIHPDDRATVDEAIADHVAGRTDAIEVEYRIQGRDGWHWIIDRGRIVERDDLDRPSRLLGTVSDVTERKAADDRLATSERRFRAAFNSGFQFESLLDLECNLLEANHTLLEFAGLDLDAVRGMPFWDTPWWMETPETMERLRSACDEARAGRTVQYQDRLRGAGDRVAFIDFSLKPILDAEGRVVQLLAEGRDITERKKAEDSVREMDALGTMGRLAARVAHEINNPLAGIQNSFLLVKDAIPESHPYYSYVGAIEREIARIAAVTRQLYETFRPEGDGTADSSVAVVISDAVNMLKQVNRAAQVQIEVDTSRAPSVLPIPSPLLRQAVYNLVQNAVEASPQDGGTVWVTAWRDGDVFWLAVRDQGRGIAPDMREKIFEPFMTTKTKITTGGMGLGLSLVRRSVQAMGGLIEVDDAPGGGAEFRLRLPIT